MTPVSLKQAYSNHMRLMAFSGIYIPLKTDCTLATGSGHSQTLNREENLNCFLFLEATPEQECHVPVRLQ